MAPLEVVTGGSRRRSVGFVLRIHARNRLAGVGVPSRMPYVPQGKKTRRQAAAIDRERRRDHLIDVAAAGVRFACSGPRLCLQMSVLLESVLADALPAERFRVTLGSLHVCPTGAGLEGIVFDPRGPEGVDGGFHSWVEDRRGELVDPSIAPTLAAEGYDVGPDELVQCAGRTFVAFGLRFQYEPLDQLELVGLDGSAQWLAAMRQLAALGRLSNASRVLVCPLDVRLRAAR